MNEKIVVTVNGKRESILAGLTLSETVKGEKPCGGHGRCGKCKVIARGELSAITDAERKLLSADELAKDVRLACLTKVLGACEIETLDEAGGARIVTDGALPELEIDPTFETYGAAIDIGTTMLAARLFDTRGKLLAETARLNPQARWGADVISRIEAALADHAHALAMAIREALSDLLAELALSAAISTRKIDGVCITGNTVMLSLLTEESVEPFSHAPFEATRLFGETLTADRLSLQFLQPNTPIYLPPCISAFVGADTVCAILATRLCENGTAMLADIGTNGEMALWHGGELTVCSTAAGPAFEGVGISMGMRGATGAIDKVSLSNGELQAHVIEDGAPLGLCASGLVDAVACMLDKEMIDESGFLEDEEIVVRSPVILTQKDIRMLQLAKSAICAGLLTLIKRRDLRPTDIPALSIAGGFGNYLNRESAKRIGLLPQALTPHSKAVGNAALAGASMLLLNSDSRAKAEQIAHNAETLELSTDPDFSEYYMTGMLLGEM